MDQASDFESEDCEFESRRGRFARSKIYLAICKDTQRFAVLNITFAAIMIIKTNDSKLKSPHIQNQFQK